MIVPPVLALALVLASMPLAPLHAQTQPVRVVNGTMAPGAPPPTAAPAAAPATSSTAPRS